MMCVCAKHYVLSFVKAVRAIIKGYKVGMQFVWVELYKLFKFLLKGKIMFVVYEVGWLQRVANTWF